MYAKGRGDWKVAERVVKVELGLPESVALSEWRQPRATPRQFNRTGSFSEFLQHFDLVAALNRRSCREKWLYLGVRHGDPPSRYWSHWMCLGTGVTSNWCGLWTSNINPLTRSHCAKPS